MSPPPVGKTSAAIIQTSELRMEIWNKGSVKMRS